MYLTCSKVAEEVSCATATALFLTAYQSGNTVQCDLVQYHVSILCDSPKTYETANPKYAPNMWSTYVPPRSFQREERDRKARMGK